MLFPEYSALFAAGIALYLLHRHSHTPGRWAALLLCAGLSAAWSAPIQARETLETTGPDVPVAVVAAVVLGMIAWLCAVVLTPAADWRVPFAKVAGALTYPLYLFHQLWGCWLIGLLVPVIGPRWTLPIVLAVLLCWSWLVHRWVERRSDRGCAAPSRAPSNGCRCCGGECRRREAGATRRRVTRTRWTTVVVGGYSGSLHLPASARPEDLRSFQGRRRGRARPSYGGGPAHGI